MAQNPKFVPTIPEAQAQGPESRSRLGEEGGEAAQSGTLTEMVKVWSSNWLRPTV